MSHAARTYLRQVKRLIPCARSLSADFLRRFEDEVWLYCEDCPVESANQLHVRFGAPDEIAEEFLTSLSPAALQQTMRRERLLIRWAVGLSIAVLVLLVTAGAFAQMRWQQVVANHAVTLVQGEETPAYWVRTNDGQDVLYWEYDYVKDEWVNVPVD